MTSNIDRRVYERDTKKSFVYITVIRQLIRCIVSGDYRTMDILTSLDVRSIIVSFYLVGGTDC